MEKMLWMTGATGFTGRYIAEEALRQGFRVTALVRGSSRIDSLPGEVGKAVIGFTNPAAMSRELEETAVRYGTPSHLIYNAGLTKAVRESDYFAVNQRITIDFMEALRSSGLMPSRVVYTSSLAAAGPGLPDGTPVTEEQKPHPVTAYGRSKLAAERSLAGKGFSEVIIARPTAIYGAGDRDVLQVFKMVKNKIRIETGNRQWLSFLAASDFARAVLWLLEKGRAGEVYHISDGRAVTRDDFYHLAEKLTGTRTLKIKTGKGVLTAAAVLRDGFARLSGRVSIFNLDKVNEIMAPNWVASIEKITLTGFRPAVSLEDGLAQTLKWYRDNGWI